MSDDNECLITAPQILRAVLDLMKRGVAIDDIPLELCRIAPYDADMLEELLREISAAA